MTTPTATLTHLSRADGSATYTHHGYTIIGSVNGPIEVQRRDEQPEEATLEVNVRPTFGVASPKERHLETLLHSTLRSVVLTKSIPRTLVQVTLQTKSLPSEEGSSRVDMSLAILPHLLHTALLSLLSASVPLRTIFTSVLVAIPASHNSAYLLSPTANQLSRAQSIASVHVFAFSGDKRLLLNESDGRFSYEEWTEACGQAEEFCCEGEEEEGGIKLEGEGMDVDAQGQEESLQKWLREVVRRKVEWEQRWKRAS